MEKFSEALTTNCQRFMSTSTLIVSFLSVASSLSQMELRSFHLCWCSCFRKPSLLNILFPSLSISQKISRCSSSLSCQRQLLFKALLFWETPSFFLVQSQSIYTLESKEMDLSFDRLSLHAWAAVSRFLSRRHRNLFFSWQPQHHLYPSIIDSIWTPNQTLQLKQSEYKTENQSHGFNWRLHPIVHCSEHNRWNRIRYEG